MFTTKVAGRFKLEIGQCDAEGNPIESTKRVVAEFDNLITNTGMDSIGTISGTGADLWDSCQVGTGTTAPAYTDTGLATWLAGTANNTDTTTGNSGSPYYYSYERQTFRFSQGEATGNLTEVGIGPSTTASTLFSRALIRDGTGSSITNGSFASGDVSWTKGTGWAINNTSGVYFNGSWSGVYTGTGTGDTLLNAGTAGTVVAGQVVDANCRIYAGTGKAGNVYVEFLDSGASVIQTNHGNVVTGGSAWTESLVTATAPALAVSMRIGCTATHSSGSAALYVDEFNWSLTAGQPTTITVLPIEFLDVTYEMRQYPPLYDVPGNVTIAGVAYTTIIRAAEVDETSTVNAPFSLSSTVNAFHAYTGSLGALTGLPTGNAGSSPGGTRSIGTYTAGNFYRDITGTWSIAQGNANIKTVVLMANPRGRFQCEFTPTIPKDNTKELTLTFRMTWARRLI